MNFGGLEKMFTANPKDCNEGDWIGLESGELFLSIKDRNPKRFKELTLQPQFKNSLNDLDGDGLGILHNLGLDEDVHEDDAMEIVKIFSNAGGNLNLLSSQGESALHMAAIYVNESVMMALVQNGADVLLKNGFQQTAIEIAREVEDEEPVPVTFGGVILRMEEAAERQRGGGGGQSNHRGRVQSKKGHRGQSKKGRQLIEKAEAFRQLGNRYYMEDKFEKALDMYKKALNLVEDHRTYGNLSATYLKIATRNLFETRREFHSNFEHAHRNAEAASKLNPTFLKHYFRQAKGYIGCRDFAKAKEVCQDGVTMCDVKEGTDYEALKSLYESLVELGEDVDEDLVMELTRF